MNTATVISIMHTPAVLDVTAAAAPFIFWSCYCHQCHGRVVQEQLRVSRSSFVLVAVLSAVVVQLLFLPFTCIGADHRDRDSENYTLTPLTPMTVIRMTHDHCCQ